MMWRCPYMTARSGEPGLSLNDRHHRRACRPCRRGRGPSFSAASAKSIRCSQPSLLRAISASLRSSGEQRTRFQNAGHRRSATCKVCFASKTLVRELGGGERYQGGLFLAGRGRKKGIKVVARVVITSGQECAFEKQCAGALSRATKEGCLSYHLFHPAQQGVYVFVEDWASREVWEKRMPGAAIRSYNAQLPPETIAHIEFTHSTRSPDTSTTPEKKENQGTS